MPKIELNNKYMWLDTKNVLQKNYLLALDTYIFRKRYKKSYGNIQGYDIIDNIMREANNMDDKLENIDNIYNDIKELLLNSKNKMLKVVNTTRLETYWHTGKIIHELLNNTEESKYGKQIVKSLSGKLLAEFGDGFSVANLMRMKNFYECFPISATL